VISSVELTENRSCDDLLLFEGTEVRNSQEWTRCAQPQHSIFTWWSL